MLILSEESPDLSGFCTQFSSEIKWETADYEKLINGIKNGSCKRFRLTANPTYSVSNNKGERGKVHAHITPEHQRKWLMNKSTANGFKLSDNNFNIVQSKWKQFYRSGSKYVTLISVTYEGVLEITDEELFRKALRNGIGRGKAYGMGLLTVMNIGGEN
ncbi:CRISPR system Cascade subunit CasE [Ruminococcus sp. YE71]|nr:CRISPR system Cascade subunit CasE [Ruminococcus sp. YE71]